MRISDWSSDVCSSDLARARPLQARRPGAGDPQGGQGRPRPRTGAGSRTAGRGVNRPAADRGGAAVRGGLVLALGKLGRAPCRERVCKYVRNSGVAVTLKKKNIL